MSLPAVIERDTIFFRHSNNSVHHLRFGHIPPENKSHPIWFFLLRHLFPQQLLHLKTLSIKQLFREYAPILYFRH